MTHLTYHSTESGFCRVMYVGPNERRPIYCVQKAFGDEYEILRCTAEGEPEYPIIPKDGVTFDLPAGDDSTDREVSQWLTKQGLASC